MNELLTLVIATGNPGKPKGTRHRATLAAEALLDGETEALTRKTSGIDLKEAAALEGNGDPLSPG